VSPAFPFRTPGRVGAVLIRRSGKWHRKLRKAGVHAELHLVEGASHFTYFIEPFAEESQDVFAELARFLDTHLGS
jgi:acetyl esterase/lipase